MATNNMKLNQDVITRAFYTEVLSDDDLFIGDPVGRKQAVALCRRLLNYVVVEGKHVSAESASKLKYQLGEAVDIEDEFESDTRRSNDAANKDTNTRKTNRSKSSKNTKVRKAVLSEDV